ncbi:MAG: SAM-dependent methyltransferase, partial [Flavobacteriales bacterium]|nr:SAM-dependent methyltransferase [Flavobacteriales bacterium]
MATKGKLYLIPNRLGLHATDKAFTPYQTEVLDVITLFLVENIKPARQLLRAVSAQKNIDNCH